MPNLSANTEIKLSLQHAVAIATAILAIGIGYAKLQQEAMQIKTVEQRLNKKIDIQNQIIKDFTNHEKWSQEQHFNLQLQLQAIERDIVHLEKNPPQD